MGMSKKIWMAQSELDHVNELINMDADDYWDAYIDRERYGCTSTKESCT